MDIEFTSHFLAKAKKLSSKERKLLSKRIEIFRVNSSDPRLKTHALTGKLKGMISFSLTHSKRAIFMYVKRNTALFLDAGSHEEVYRK